MNAPLSAALAGYTLTEAVADFAEFAETYQVIPGTFSTDFRTTAAHLLKIAEDLHITTVRQLLAKNTLVLRMAAEVNDLSKDKSADERNKIHVHRNTLLTLALGAAHTAGINTAGITGAVFTLARRTQKTHRPLTDDEITLLRTNTIVTMAGSRASQAAAVYALCDAGQEVRETTLVTAADVDDTAAPTMVHSSGRRGIEDRVLPLETFHTGVLGHRIAVLGHVRAGSTIAYSPRTNDPGTDQAMSSAHGVIARALKAVGLDWPDVTASSVRRWRIAHTYDREGLRAAMELAGCNASNTLELADRREKPVQDPSARRQTKQFTLNGYAA